MLGIEEYTKGFMNGMWCDSSPNLDLSSMESIGCYDGYQYKEYTELTGQEEIKQEQLIAVIDKYHTQALKRYTENNAIREAVGHHK